uniref:cytochrome P450 4AB22 precursor n=1 Tax=Nasonia vitripennis TaxID=7425 RepID=UPI0001C4CFF5|nr:cytochrome P450 4AB22 precursor [Nasonia vitripennis]
MTIYFLLIFLVLLFHRIYARNIKYRSLLKKIPGPPTLPLLGNLLIFNVPVEKQWDIVRSLTKQYYPICKIWLGPRHAVVSLLHPDDIEVLLTSSKHINKGDSYTYLHTWLKTGLLTSSGDKWRQRRKILTPAFHFNILKKYMDITNENSINFIEALRNEGEETIQNLTPLCSKYTLNIILESAMGIVLDKVDKKTADDYKNAVYEIGRIIMYRLARPYIREWMLNPLMNLARVQKRVLKTLHDFTEKVVKDRREYHERTENKYLDNFTNESHCDDVYAGTGGRKKRMAMLDLLLSAERDGLIDDEGIKEEVDTFTFEGHDTTAMAMTFALLLLAENKKAQDKAREEVTEILDRSEGNMGMAQIQEFNYLERCIKESLRLFPPVATMARTITEDLQLKNYLVPAGTEVMYHLWEIHRDPNFWEEPLKFDPNRFLPERSQGRHPFSYVPFSAGPRNCIGQKFAMMELKSLIGRILYNFKLEPIDKTADMPMLLDIVIRPAKPVYTRFVRIDK